MTSLSCRRQAQGLRALARRAEMTLCNLVLVLLLLHIRCTYQQSEHEETDREAILPTHPIEGDTDEHGRQGAVNMTTVVPAGSPDRRYTHNRIDAARRGAGVGTAQKIDLMGPGNVQAVVDSGAYRLLPHLTVCLATTHSLLLMMMIL
ncbi:PREDICTED: uncharacterized protein LOC106806740 [Priapulus caudatus]|uniref:Uncharacterized protein LOC106806740 n=1 Tax=Priapulus caudatus TaxID=37621 RepID=A0ABM1DWF0_PRICU|nr:PREDICTED: uncharacterized protein LOC106806740 [Priapulus caudatus]